MKELKKIVIFILCFAGLIFVADRIIGFMMSRIFEGTITGQSGGKVNYYLKIVPDSTAVVMGDSRAMNQIIPDSLSMPAFNLSHAGMDDVFQESLLHLFISEGKKPHAVLLHIDPRYYTGEDETEKSLFLKQFYGRSSVLDENIHSSGKYERFKFLFSSYRYNNIVLNIINNSRKKGVTQRGYDPLLPTIQDSVRTQITAAADTATKPVPLNTMKFRHLENIIKMCRENNIRLICFTSPAWKKKNLLPLKNVMSSTDSLLSANKIHYLNYLKKENSPAELQRAVFWNDCEHLNDSGARIFSSIFSRDLATQVFAPTPMRMP